MTPYTPPSFQADAFNCPHCNAYARQSWYDVYYHKSGLPNYQSYTPLEVVICDHCHEVSLWLQITMIYPDNSGAQLPNSDLRDDIKSDYLEARSIVNRSPRGAVAILRLCVQKLCEQVGEKGNNINDDIASLVKKGLPVRIQQALDIVRVVGNNAVHPGQINLEDNVDVANQLFALINLIAEVMITQPKHVEDFYKSLPGGAIEAINKRDTK
jgi:glutaredoxin